MRLSIPFQLQRPPSPPPALLVTRAFVRIPEKDRPLRNGALFARYGSEGSISSSLRPERQTKPVLIRPRIGSDLEMHHLAGRPFACVTVERRSGSPSRPESFTFPARRRIADPAIHPFSRRSLSGYGTRRITNFPFTECDQRIGLIAVDEAVGIHSGITSLAISSWR